MIIATLLRGILSIKNWVNPIGIEWILLPSLGILGILVKYI